MSYVDDYNDEHYDRVTLRVPKGTKAQWQRSAAWYGCSLNFFLTHCVTESPPMQRNKALNPHLQGSLSGGRNRSKSP